MRFFSIPVLLCAVFLFLSCSSNGSEVYAAIEKQNGILRKAMALAKKGDSKALQKLEDPYMAAKKQQSAAIEKVKRDQEFLDTFRKKMNDQAMLKKELAVYIDKLKIPNNFF